MSDAVRQMGRVTGRAGLLTAALALLLIVLGPAGPAQASHSQITVFDPTPQLLNGETAARRADTLDRLQALGVDVVRIQVQWRYFAPSPNSSLKPFGFDGSDPGEYPLHAFDTLDSVVRGVEARGMEPQLTPTGPVPAWASSNGTGLYEPDPGEFGDFVAALGRRYDGACTPPLCLPGPESEALPRVERWAIWNEPNLKTFLRPQRNFYGRTVSGRLYRRLFLAAQSALDETGHVADTLLIGETSPSRGNGSTPPLKFLRQVLCLSRNYRSSADCKPIDADGWSHHPYNPRIPPWERPTGDRRSVISIGDIGRLVRALHLADRAGATTRMLPVYVTEYGVESYPQRRFGVSLQRQAEFLAAAEYLLYRNRWVRSFGQYLLDDDQNAGQPLSFQTGLRFADSQPKPAYDAFQIPLLARRRSNGSVRLWGHVRPGKGPYLVRIRYRNGERGDVRRLGEVKASGGGYFRLTVPYRRRREWQASCVLSGGAVLRGPFIRSYRLR